MPRNTWVIGIATAMAGGLAVWLTGGWGGESTVRVLDSFGLLSFAVFGVVCAWLAARSARGQQRKAWICLAIGLAGWVAGDVISLHYEWVLGMNEFPFPSLADAGYLMFPVGACLALVLFPTGYSTQSRTRFVLDGLIIAGALFQVSWVLVLQNVYEAGGASAFALGISLAYPVSDIVVVTVALLVLARAQTGQRATLFLLLVGNVLNALSDSAFLFLSDNDAYFSSNIIDIGWIVALLALSSAALVSRQTSHTEEQVSEVPSRVSLWLPYPPLSLAVLVCLPRFTLAPGMGPILATSFLLVFVVLARQYIVVGQNRRLLEIVADQALHDPLTGLANRALFNDRLTHAMLLHQRDNQSVAVMSLDLDDFKLINDTLGHPAGDALLSLAADRILGSVRAADTVARLGGDEFAVLMEGDAESSRLIADRIVRAFNEHFVVDGQIVMVRPSIGLAITSAENRDISADALLKHADVAMYSAKRSLDGGAHMFTPDMYTNTGRGEIGAKLLGQLRDAIDNFDLTVVYQPKFDLQCDRIVGVEALVRWPHPERGMLGPDEFLPLVRRHGLMRAVTELVIEQALDDAAQWQSQGVDVPMAINVFAPSLSDIELPQRVVDAVVARNLSPDMLTVEITEDLLLENIDRARTVLETLRLSGIRIAVDDFGSGYSALRYLRDLPIDEVKLDRQFIAPMLDDPRSAAIVGGIIDLAHALGVTTVAEGVENAETAQLLRRRGCDIAQGYYFSLPLGADDMLALLSATKEPAAASSN